MERVPFGSFQSEKLRSWAASLGCSVGSSWHDDRWGSFSQSEKLRRLPVNEREKCRSFLEKDRLPWGLLKPICRKSGSFLSGVLRLAGD